MPLPHYYFLLTDVESSTRLWEEQTEAMRFALRWHDAIMRQAIESHGGQVVKTIGDAFHAVFPTPESGVLAACAAQHRLRNDVGGTPLPLRVRMCLHCGEAEPRDGDYYGPTMNRLARLLALAHGGQTILSGAMYTALAAITLPDISWQDLGTHRLRDLNAPEQVYQVHHPALSVQFPPLLSLSNHRRHNLPVQSTSFIGRSEEIGQIRTLFQRARLVTLLGAGGCGKTRLSLQVAAESLTGDGDGVWFIELAALADQARVIEEVARVLQLCEEIGRPLLQTVLNHLQSARLLLVLDNCEHLLEACARFCDTVLRSCPNITILATSREPLAILGEQTYRVPSLSLPDLVDLFTERARQVRQDFPLTQQNAFAVAIICQRLDGIPLAIELAAARVRALSVEDISARLDNRFRLLTGGSRAALPRQQTLRALIDWSYDLLNASERTMLQRLSVFAGGWTQEAAEAIGIRPNTDGTTIENWEVVDLLTALVDKSLIVVEMDSDSDKSPRYHLLETIRQYAQERLKETDTEDAIRTFHANWFREWVTEASDHLEGAEQKTYLEEIACEQENLYTGITWCLQSPHVSTKDADSPLWFAVALRRYWEVRSYLREGRNFTRRLLEAVSPADIARPTVVLIRALHTAGALAQHAGEHAVARSYHEQGYTSAQALGDTPMMAMCLSELAIVEQETGNALTAIDYQQQVIAIYRETKNLSGEAIQLSNLGVSYLSLGNREAAKSALQDALRIQRQLGDTRSIAIALNNLGDLALEEGKKEEAYHLQCEGLALTLEIGARRSSAYSLESLAAIAAVSGDFERTALLYGAATALREQLGAPLAPVEVAEFEEKLALVAPTSDDPLRVQDRWQEAIAEGRQMSLTEAASYALTFALDHYALPSR